MFRERSRGGVGANASVLTWVPSEVRRPVAQATSDVSRMQVQVGDGQ